MRLLPSESGELVARKSQNLDALPNTFEYGSQSPFKERTHGMERLYGGFGQRVQPDRDEHRYYYAIDLDLSINGYRIKGPRFTAETVNAGQPIRQLVTALHGGSEVLWALSGNAVHRRVSDGSWSSSLTPASAPRQAVRFKAAGGSPIDALYLATASSNLYDYDGTNWTLQGSGNGPPGEKMQAVARIRDELWIGYDNFVVKTEADPRTRANWSGPIDTNPGAIGDGSSSVNWLATLKDQLYVFKEDGIYTVTPQGFIRDLFGGLGLARSSDNGRNTSVWLDSMWVPWADSFYQILADASLSPEGTEELFENDSEVRGRIVGTSGHNTWFNYCVIYNPANGHSYLGKYGSWIGDPERSAATFLPVYHFALKKWASKQATCIQVVPAAVVGASNDRLYVGFSDGTVQWCVLPRGGPNPTADTNCTYSADHGYLYWPSHHAQFKSDNKITRGFSVFGPTLSTSAYVDLEYRTDPNASWTEVVRTTDDGEAEAIDFTLSGQRADMPPPQQPVARAIEVREVLKTDVDAAANVTPVVESVAIHEQVRPSVALEYDLTIDARFRGTKLNGSVDRRTPEEIRAEVQRVIATPEPVPVVLPDGSTEYMSWIDYRDMQRERRRSYGLSWAIGLQCIQLKTLSNSFSVAGLSYGTLENYTYGELEDLL